MMLKQQSAGQMVGALLFGSPESGIGWHNFLFHDEGHILLPDATVSEPATLPSR
jgi:hypothetical protein